MNSYRWSDFRLRTEISNTKIVIKSTLTSATIRLDPETEEMIDGWLTHPTEPIPTEIELLISPDIALIVPRDHNEYASWRDRLVQRRNDEAHIFILHFLPTIQCQLRCGYCFENGANRMKGMSDEIIDQTASWLDNYLADHPEIDAFRLVLFGGEPLLRKDIVEKGLTTIHNLVSKRGLEFWTEITTNGELLDEKTAALLTQHEWLRVQITLDGPEDIHNARRPGVNNRPTFSNVLANIEMLVTTNYIGKVDIRLSFDHDNADHIPELVRELARRFDPTKINLSLGLITPTLDKPERQRWEEERVLGSKAVATWSVAKECGFQIPDEFITGPWCVAIAKHSAILQPDGTLQKCFCTAGRSEYNFATVADRSETYLQDPRFEQWRRTDQCIEERCQFLPLCGGGCIHDAIVSKGGAEGSGDRFCQKPLLEEYNVGLLRLNY